ncbi:MAG: ribosome-associated translation inhibitor RaiA [Streptosporangiales bacterium]|nr:ribosome-associated translation inhibitor RaiA [Streptosporangiales bacterium]
MDIIVKARHTAVHEHFRQHVTSKLAKIEKLDHKVIRVSVEVSKERNPRLAGRRERVELTIRSRGPAIRAEASADDRYAAFDAAMDKLENRLRKLSDRRKIHRGVHTPASAGVVAARLAEQNGSVQTRTAEVSAESGESTETLVPHQRTASESAEPTVPIEMEGDGPLVVREKSHRAQPMTIDQALFEMELVGHDFYLFRDRECGQPSVVYRRRGYDYGVLRLVDE